MQQVLINLMRNAVEAMETSQQRLLELSAIAETDGMVQVRVKDIGPGLPNDVADRLFQPFVSTKESVGLSICHTIVESNDGRIWAEPNPEGGAVFHFHCRQHRLADTAKTTTGRYQTAGFERGALVRPPYPITAVMRHC